MTPENKQQILNALNLRMEYESLGLKINNTTSNEKGWVSCYALGREEKTASAGINLDPSSKHYGYYNDFGTQDDEKCISFFDVCAKFGTDSSAQEAFYRLAEITGIISNTSDTQTQNKNQWFADLKIEKHDQIGFVTHKPPCTIEGFLATGGQKGFVPGQGNVIIFPIYNANLTIQGGATFNWFGGLLLGQKNLMIKGTTAGLMGLHGLNLIKAGTAEIVYVVEGIPDMVALQSKVPSEKWNTVAVVTHSGGANEHPHDWKVNFFTGQNVVVIPDADNAEISGGEKWSQALTKHATSVRFVKLPYEVTETSGKDLRDWFNEGGSFEELEKLADAADAYSKTDSPHTAEFYEKLLHDLQVFIYGQDEIQQITGYSLVLNRWFTIKDRNRYTFLNLIGDCGDIVHTKVIPSQSKDLSEGMYSFKQVVEAFCWEAAKNNIRDNDRRGQGIWHDPQTKDAVIVIGNGQAAVWNGTTLERLIKPAHGGLQLNTQTSYSKFVDFDTLKDALENYDKNKAPAAFVELKKLLTQWNWNTNEEITVTLIAALATASFIQSAFTFRPQVCIVGHEQKRKHSCTALPVSTIQITTVMFLKTTMTCCRTF